MVKHTLKAGSCTSVFVKILFCLLVSLSLVSNSMAGVWMGGSKSDDEPGVYGVQGVYDSTNIPGARHNSMAWVRRAMSVRPAMTGSFPAKP